MLSPWFRSFQATDSEAPHVRVTTAFNKILSIPGAWVASVEFTPDGVVVGLRRRRGCPRCPCGWKGSGVYDSSVRRWRHLDLGSSKLWLEQARGFDAPVVLAGGSQGSGVAARLALGGAVADLAGFMCVVGAPWPGSWIARNAVPGLRVVGGADDVTAETQRQFAREAGELGLEIDLVKIPNLDHRYPDDWGTLAPELLARWLG